MNEPDRGAMTRARVGALCLLAGPILGILAIGCVTDVGVADAEVATLEENRRSGPPICSGFNHDYQYLGSSFVSDAFASGVSVQLDNGNLAAVDTVEHNGVREILVTHVLDDGRLVWARRYWSPGIDLYGSSLTESHDKNHLIIVGRAGDDTLVVQLDSATGNIIWSTIYYEDAETPTDFTVSKGLLVRRYTDALGETAYVVAGTAWNQAATDEHTVLLRLDVNGAVDWGYRYEPADAEDVTDIPVALEAKDALEDPLWIGLNHRPDESSSFALLDVNPMDGSPGVMTFYPQPEEGAQVHFGDLARLSNDDFVATYSVLLPEFGFPVAALLPLDAGRSPGPQSVFWSTQVGDHGLAIQPVASGYDIGTYAYDQDVSAFVPALLSVDANGSVLSYAHYRDHDFGGIGIAPMATTTDGYLLKTFDQEFLHLTRVIAGSPGCCERPIEHASDAWEVGYEKAEYVRWVWNVDGLDIFSTPEEPVVGTCQ